MTYESHIGNSVTVYVVLFLSRDRSHFRLGTFFSNCVIVSPCLLHPFYPYIYIRIHIYVSVCLFRSLRCSSDLVHLVLFVVVISSSSLVLIGIVFCFCFFIYLCQVLFSSNKLNSHSSIQKTYNYNGK